MTLAQSDKPGVPLFFPWGLAEQITGTIQSKIPIERCPRPCQFPTLIWLSFQSTIIQPVTTQSTITRHFALLSPDRYIFWKIYIRSLPHGRPPCIVFP